MSDKPVFSMSKFVNNEDRLQAMATYYRDLIDELELEARVLTEKVKELEGYLQLAESLLGDNQHSYYLSALTTNRGK